MTGEMLRLQRRNARLEFYSATVKKNEATRKFHKHQKEYSDTRARVGSNQICAFCSPIWLWFC